MFLPRGFDPEIELLDKMNRLYEAEERDDDLDINALASELTIAHDASLEVVEHNIKAHNHCLNRADAMRKEAKALADAAKIAENYAVRFEEIVEKYMKAIGQVKLETAAHTVKFSKSHFVDVIDESLIPSKFVKVVTSIDKAGLKKALKEGKIEGVRLSERRNIQIK